MSALHSRRTTQLLPLVGGLVAFLLVLVMPLPDGMTPPGQRMLAVMVLMATWWIGEATPLAVTALLPLVLFPLLGIMSSKEVAPHYTHHLVFLFLGGFMIALAMEKWNFHKRLALLVITAIGTSTTRMILGFMAASAFLSMWISNTACTMMMLPIARGVVQQIAADATLSGKKTPETAQAIEQGLGLVLMLGLAYSASIGGVGTLIGTAPNIVFAGLAKTLFPNLPEISFLQWMLFALPIVCLFVPLVWIGLCRVTSPIPLSHIELGARGQQVIHKELQALGRLSSAEQLIGLVFGMTAVLWMFRQPLTLGSFTIPGWSGLFPHPTFFHDATVAMLMGLLLMILPVGFGKGLLLNGKREQVLLDWETVQKGVPWSILYLFGGGFALAGGIAKTGLDQWFGMQLAEMMGFPLWVVVFLICLGVTFLTEVTSNTATTTMVLPIIGAAAVAAHLPPFALMIPATLAASFAFMLPVATPPNAIIYSSGWVTIPQMFRAGLLFNILGTLLITGMAVLLLT